MEGLGRSFNVVTAAEGEWLSLRDATGVTFILNGADTYTLQEATDASGTGAKNLTVVDHYYAQTAGDGSAQWTESTQSASHQVTVSGGVAAIEVHADQLTDGYSYVSVSANDAGEVIAILHSLVVQRHPTKLAAVAA